MAKTGKNKKLLRKRTESKRQRNAKLRAQRRNWKRDYLELAAHHNQHCTCLAIF